MAAREELIDKKVVRHKNLRSNKSGLMVAHSKIWGADYDTAIIQTPDPNYKQFCWPDEFQPGLMPLCELKNSAREENGLARVDPLLNRIENLCKYD